MKKLFLLLPLIPLSVTSCKGMFVNADQALEILEAIHEDYLIDGLNYTKVTYESFLENGEQGSEEIKVIYDKGARFYYSYCLTDTHIYEEWHYVKDKDNNQFIYNMRRNDGKVNEKGDPDVTGEVVPFDDTIWNDVLKMINDNLSAHLEFEMEKALLAINYKKALPSGDVSLSSFNSRSIYVEGEADYLDFLYQIDDGLPVKYRYYNNTTHYKTFKADYSKANYTYLNI